MLPGKNGFDICKDLRRNGKTTPILMLTSRSDEADTVAGLELGADDYVTKPFGIPELRSRIRALLRRSVPSKKEIAPFSFGTVYLDFKKQEAMKQNKPIPLTSKEFEILQYFIHHEGEVITRETLLNDIWGYEHFPTTRTIDNYILSIRKKIEEDSSAPRHLLTIHSSGYKFVK